MNSTFSYPPDTVIIVLGERQNCDGSMHREYKNRVELARTLAENKLQTSRVFVVFTGGVTRAGTPPESAQAVKHFAKLLPGEIGTRIRVLSEDRSLTTSSNLTEARGVLWDHNLLRPDKLIIIGRKSQLPKVRVLMEKFAFIYPAKVEFVSGIDTKPLWWRVLDRTVFVALAYIDPRETWLAGHVNWLVKKVTRNG